MATKFSCDIPALLIISALLQEKLCGKSPNQKHRIESLSLVIWWNMVEKRTSFCRMRAIQNLMLMVGSIFILHQRPTFLDESVASRSFHTVSVENIAGDTLVRLNDLSNKKQRNTKCIYLFARSAREKERWFHRLRWACSRFSTSPSVDENEFDQPSGQTLQRRLRRTLSLPDGGETIPLEFTRDYFMYTLHSMQFSR